MWLLPQLFLLFLLLLLLNRNTTGHPSQGGRFFYDHLDADRHVSTSNKRAARDIVSSGIKVCHIASVRKPGHQPGIVLADRPADGKVIW
ncbi:hypothetical protein [Ferrovum myxofaciens]|uniref:hypothetical protein n=1 Tax=Ferrovum myxofaciens TaxID=416213 RepID=UPI003EC0A729